MFMLTLSKAGLRRVGVAALGVVMLCGCALVGRFLNARAVAASAAGTAKIETTQDIQNYFTGYGLEADPASITADRVKIPRKWDDSFQAFNTVIGQSGCDLAKYKGKTVEKWLALIPARSTGDASVYGVLLVYKKKAVGAYLLTKPAGTVTGLGDAQSPMGEAAQTAGDAAGELPPAQPVSGEDVSGDDAAGAPSCSVVTELETPADEVSGEMADSAADVSLDVDLQADADGFPVE